MNPNDLLQIPGGVFLMGQPDGRDEERPAHQVTVAPFRLCRYQVTNQDFAAFRLFDFTSPTLPVTSVSWFDAVGLLPLALRRMGHGNPAPHRSRMGVRRPGRHGPKLYPWGDDP